jgi:5-methyltetrahydrofolate--homocysteine methyltransferase
MTTVSARPVQSQQERADALRHALATRVVVADGAMGTMLQAQDPTMEDFQGLEGCNEVLSVTRPDIVRSVHDAYFAVGVDCVETNTFGANFSALNEYETEARPRWVLGSIGPGTKLPSLGHLPFAALREGFRQNAAGLIAGGADALLVETSQDLLQTKAAVLGAKQAQRDAGVDLPLIAQVTVETTGTMLLGSEIGAALAALEPLGVDLIGMNCATGPAEMTEHLRYLARNATVGLSCMPNAGLPVLGRDGAHYELTPAQLADAHEVFTREYGLGLVGGCCGTTPEHLRAVVERVRGQQITARDPHPEAAAASLYQSVPFRQDASYLAIGERTNANGSKKFRESMLAADWQACVEIARDQIREGAHLLDLCVDYVGRDGVEDMRKLAGLLATASTLPIVLDSTEPPVLEAGLQMLGGRAVLNSDRADHRRAGPGPYRGDQGRDRGAADRGPGRAVRYPGVVGDRGLPGVHAGDRAGGVAP